MANVLTNVIQEKYSTQALIAMKVQKPLGLAKICEKANATQGESYNIYRADGSMAKDGLPSMYNNDDKGYTGDTGSSGGDGGALKAFKIYGSYISSQHKIPDIDLKKTSLDAKGTLQKTMAIALAQKEDEKIMKAIKDKDSELETKALGNADDMSKDKVIKMLLAKISVAHANAKMTPDGQKGVSVMMNIKDWELLVQSDYFLKDEFQGVISWGDSEAPAKIRGAEILLTKDANLVPSGTLYIIPSNTCAVANWKGSEKAVAEFHETDGARWHLQMRKYMGATCVEPAFITKMTYKAVA